MHTHTQKTFIAKERMLLESVYVYIHTYIHTHTGKGALCYSIYRHNTVGRKDFRVRVLECLSVT